MTLSDDDIALAGEYVLGAMDRTERSAIEARMRSDTAFAAEIARWELQLDPMLAEIAPEAPPALAWDALETRLFAPPKRPGWAWFGLAAGLSTVLLGAVLWFGAPLQPQQGPLWISDLVSSDGQVRLAALYDEQRGEMRVSVGGDAPQQGRDFELWLIAGEAAPVSLGVMPRSGAAAMPIPDDLRALMAGATLAITDEPEGGAPQGRATGPVVALAPLRRI